MNKSKKYLLSAAEFAQYEGISRSTLKRQISKKEISIVKVKAKSGYRKNHIENLIHFSQLSTEEAQARFLKDRGPVPEKKVKKNENQFCDLKLWEKEVANKREVLIKEYSEAIKDAPGNKSTTLKRHFAKPHSINYRTLDRWANDYKVGGYYALVPAWNPGNRKNLIKNDKGVSQFIEEKYLIPFGPSVKETWEVYCKEFALKRDKLFSYRTVVDLINSKWTKEQQLLIRNKEEWDRRYSPYVRRDWNKAELNECWVGDAKQIDVACLFRNKPIFPWFTAFLDAHSRKFVGWILTAVHDSWAIAQAFVYAVSVHGTPQTIYIDRGKPYRSKLIAGKGKVINLFNEIDQTIIPGVFRDLGSEIFYASPYNAREKIIEPNFKIFTLRLKHLPGYRGHSVKTRPKKLEKEIKSGKLLSFDELSQEIDRIINDRNARPHSTIGKIPNSCYENYTPVIPSKDILAYLLMDQDFITAKDSTVSVKGLTYRGEELWRLAGETVEVRRDPRDIRRAAIIYKGKFFEFANLEIPDHYRSPITLESVKTAARTRRRISKYRRDIVESESVIDDPLKFAVELDNKEKLRQREIRPANSKVRSIHKKEQLAKDVVKGIRNQEIEEVEREAVASGETILGRLIRSSKKLNEEKDEGLKIKLVKHLTIDDPWGDE